MGIVFNADKSYINKPVCHPTVSRQRVIKRLTRRNSQFLQSLGLKVRGGGGRTGKVRKIQKK